MKYQAIKMSGSFHGILKRLDGLNCDLFTFDIKYMELNASFHKTKIMMISNPIITS